MPKQDSHAHTLVDKTASQLCNVSSNRTDVRDLFAQALVPAISSFTREEVGSCADLWNIVPDQTTVRSTILLHTITKAKHLP